MYVRTDTSYLKLIKEKEDAHIELWREKLSENSGPGLDPKSELSMRDSFRAGATQFWFLGLREGNQRRTEAIKEALGLTLDEETI